MLHPLKLTLCLSLVMLTNAGIAQLESTSELHLLLAQKDSLLFHAAFNSCDTAVLENLFTEDFEFYHDKGGLTEGRAAFITPIKENCAQLDHAKPQPSKRILIPNSLAVYPLYKDGILYGAIQHGRHRFEFLDETETYQRGDLAKFTHVWVKENSVWKVKRELSYDHQYNP